MTPVTRPNRDLTGTANRRVLGNVGVMPSLSRAEAIDRARLITVEHYRLDLDLTDRGEEFTSDTTIRFGCAEPGSQTFVDVKAASVTAVTINGQALDPAVIREGRLPLTDLAADNEVRITARMAYSSDGEGMHRHIDPADGNTYLYAMSFLDAGPRWFASFDQPDLKAPYDITVSCPDSWIVLGNGAAARTGPGRWQLATTRPLSTYFVTLVAGPYHSVTAEHDGIPLGVHARASLAEYLDAEAPEMLDVTRRAFDRYHELFGIRYPFGEYHQVFCPDFNAGAMENPGCVTLRDPYVFRAAATKGERGMRANTIVHEMAHMWFGDLVTMQWWDDLWLNESFAEYMAHRVCGEVTAYDAWTEFGIRRKAWGYVADQAPSTHPVAGNGSADAAAALADFDGISYAKGAAVLKQLAAYLGDEVFFAGLRRHFNEHAYSNAEFADLIAAWAAEGAESIEEWASSWLRTSGLDTLTAFSDQDGIVVTKDAPDTSQRPHAVRVVGYDRGGQRVFEQPVKLSGPTTRLVSGGAAPSLVVADGLDDTWAKVRFGPGGWSELGRMLPVIEDPLARVVGYNAVRDGVTDAEVDPAEALSIVLGAARAEADDVLLADIMTVAITDLAGPFAAVGDRPRRLAAINTVAVDLLLESAPRSDRQLIAARAVIRSSSDVALLRSWLAGRDLPDKLEVDAELRWQLVCRLAALGAFGATDIAEELERDRSTSGRGHAAMAKAIRPAVDAKVEAWALLTEPSQTPTHELYATAEGFFAPGQETVTAPFVERFFSEMPATASHRQGWALARIVLLGYPDSATDRTTLGWATAAIEQRGLESGVRRSLIDATDRLRRAVLSLERYGSR
jgi:aminopeptidase N